MHGSMHGSAASPEVRQALHRVIAGRTFARAGQLRRLLSYLVETSLAGREGTLKETVIGVDVFDLPADFDPKIDPVVRMGMRRLRGRLQQYFENEGLRDTTLIVLEPGDYTPKFLARSSQEATRISIAVLPYDACSKADREVGGVLREGLLMRLSKNPSLHLVANETMSRNAPGHDTATFAGTMHASFLLRGSYAAEGETIQVFTELLSCENNERLWVGTHQQAASADVWRVQNDIAREVEKRIFAQIGQPKERALAAVSPELGLRRLILQGRFHLQQNNPDSLRKSFKCFEAAVEQQPASALGWAGLSVTQMWMVMYHMVPAEQGWQSAAAAAGKAVSLDPRCLKASLQRP